MTKRMAATTPPHLNLERGVASRLLEAGLGPIHLLDPGGGLLGGGDGGPDGTAGGGGGLGDGFHGFEFLGGLVDGGAEGFVGGDPVDEEPGDKLAENGGADGDPYHYEAVAVAERRETCRHGRRGRSPRDRRDLLVSGVSSLLFSRIAILHHRLGASGRAETRIGRWPILCACSGIRRGRERERDREGERPLLPLFRDRAAMCSRHGRSEAVVDSRATVNAGAAEDMQLPRICNCRDPPQRERGFGLRLKLRLRFRHAEFQDRPRWPKA